MNGIHLNKPNGKIRTWCEKHYKAAPPYALCFTAEEAGSSVGMCRHDDAPTAYIEYSTDGRTWQHYVIEPLPEENARMIQMPSVGSKVYFRAEERGNEGFSDCDGTLNPYTQCNFFVGSGKFAASGSVMSLLDKNNEELRTITRPGAFYLMFAGCSALTVAPELPALTVPDFGYYQMFLQCTSLTQPPVLPATSIGEFCYHWMFGNCTSLKTLPNLYNVDSMPSFCFMAMFKGCSNLKIHSEQASGRTEWKLRPDISFDRLSSVYQMFEETGGTFVGEPIPGTSYWVGD